MKWFETYYGTDQQAALFRALEEARGSDDHYGDYDDDRPRLNAYERWLWRQFRQLAGQRGSSMGPVPEAIPVSEMRAYHQWLDLDGMCPPEEFAHFMILLDRETRTFRAEAAKKDKPLTEPS